MSEQKEFTVYLFTPYSSSVVAIDHSFAADVKAEMTRMIRKWNWKDVDKNQIHCIGQAGESDCPYVIRFVNKSEYHDRIMDVLRLLVGGRGPTDQKPIEPLPKGCYGVLHHPATTDRDPDTLDLNSIHLVASRYVSRKARMNVLTGTSSGDLARAVASRVLKDFGFQPQVNKWPENGFDGTY